MVQLFSMQNHPAKSLFGFPPIGYGRQILFYTALIFFAVAAGYPDRSRGKNRLV
ncbi:MAG: hypothetical protein SH848_11755 [Saprospiraceae bacterium]|nr:hypothetical protein [Saprospiraceae bacterium]MDZ4704599.1 hypothetical protein [Saprospiraceae bacterium]